MPYPNEHAARITDPGQYEKFARKNIAPGIDIILGISGGKSETQAYRFDKNKFAPEEAKQWLKDHNEKYISFEPASEKASLEDKQTFNVDNKEIFRAGTWKGKTYTEKDLDSIVMAYDDLKDKLKIPLKLGHSAEQSLLQQEGFPAAGWITNLKRIGDRLIASFKDVPRKVKEFIENGGYKQVSSEIWNNVKFNNKEYPKMLMGVALLGADVPAVIGLNDFGEFYSNYLDSTEKELFTLDIEGGEKSDMNIVHYCKSCQQEFTLTDEQIKDEKSRQCPICKSADIEKKKFTKEPDNMPEPKEKELEKLVEQFKLESKEKDDKIQKLEKERTEFESKVTKFTSEQKSKEIKGFIDEQKKEGHILPANESMIQTIMENADESSKIKFSVNGKEEEKSLFESIKSLISSLPNIVKFAEKSQEGANQSKEEFKFDSELGDENEQKIHFFSMQYIKENKLDSVKDYEKAMVETKKAHPELVEKKG